MNAPISLIDGCNVIDTPSGITTIELSYGGLTYYAMVQGSWNSVISHPWTIDTANHIKNIYQIWWSDTKLRSDRSIGIYMRLGKIDATRFWIHYPNHFNTLCSVDQVIYGPSCENGKYSTEPRHGNCCEEARLMVAVARCVNIPARYVNIKDKHTFAQYYTDTWKSVDFSYIGMNYGDDHFPNDPHTYHEDISW